MEDHATERLLKANAQAPKDESRGIASPRLESPPGHDFSRVPARSSTSRNAQPMPGLNRAGDIYGQAQESENKNPEQFFGIQKKSLQVSDPNDTDEKEADKVARKVVAGQSAEIHERSRTVNRTGEGSTAIAREFQSRLETGKSSGKSLDDSTRGEMESKMGADFGDVRIHTGIDAHNMSESINARAFTYGSNVYFKQGEYNPYSRQGKELLAHELAHTVQQGAERIFRQQEKPVKDYYQMALLRNTKLEEPETGSYYGKLLAEFFNLVSYQNISDDFLDIDRSKYPEEVKAVEEKAWELRPLKAGGAEFDIEVTRDQHRIVSFSLTRKMPDTTNPTAGATKEIPYIAYYDIFYEKPDTTGGKPKLSTNFLRENSQSAAPGASPVQGDAYQEAPLTGRRKNKPFTDTTNKLLIEYPYTDNSSRSLAQKYDFTFPKPALPARSAQTEYFKDKGPGEKNKYLILHFLDSKLLEYRDENIAVLKANKIRFRDSADQKKLKQQAIDRLKERKIDEVVDCSGTRFIVQARFVRDEGSPKHVKTDSVGIMYLGSARDILAGSMPKDQRDVQDYRVDKYKRDNKADNIEVSGLETIQDKRERLQILGLAHSLVKTDKLSDAHIDMVIDITDVPANKTEKVYYSFTIEKPDVDKGNVTRVEVKRIGKKGEAGIGDAEKLRVEDFYGYNPDWDASKLKTEISKRYPAIKNITAEDKPAVLKEARQLLEDGAGTPEWFKTNYNINIRNDGEAIKNTLKKKWNYDTFNSKRKKHPLLGSQSETDGIQIWSAKELRYMEMGFQKLSKPLLENLQGTSYIRQKEHLLFSNFRALSGLTLHKGGVKSDVVIYDGTFNYRDPDTNLNVPRDDISFRGGSRDVTSVSTESPLHETGHVIQHQGSAGKENGDKFKYFYETILAGDAESEGVTDYARSKKESEYFPEAFKLYSLDPEFMFINRPKVFMWFTYLQLKGSAPSAETSKKFVKWYTDQVASNNKPAEEEVNKYISSLK